MINNDDEGLPCKCFDCGSTQVRYLPAEITDTKISNDSGAVVMTFVVSPVCMECGSSYCGFEWVEVHGVISDLLH